MKVLFTAMAVAVTLATPAFSQTTDRSQGDQVRTSDPYLYGRETRGNQSTNRVREQRSSNARNDVYSQRGEYLGSDPDPIVRDQLGQDPSQGD